MNGGGVDLISTHDLCSPFLVIVENLYLGCILTIPPKADFELIVDSYAPFTFSIALEGFKMIPSQLLEGLQVGSCADLFLFDPRFLMYGGG